MVEITFLQAVAMILGMTGASCFVFISAMVVLTYANKLRGILRKRGVSRRYQRLIPLLICIVFMVASLYGLISYNMFLFERMGL